MRLKYQTIRFATRLQWLMRELEPDHFRQRIAAALPGGRRNRNETLGSARSVMRELLHRNGFGSGS